MIPRERIGRIDFTIAAFQDAVQLVLSLPNSLETAGRPGISVHFANAYNVALARSDSGYAHLLNSANYVFSDGVPITWVGKRAHPALSSAWERVYGPDVMTAVLEQSTNSHPRHYLLGASPEVLDSLEQAIHARFPHAAIVGSESPPFREPTPEELQQRDQRIRESRADMVWVGLGTPKQDYEVARLAENLPVVALAVGAAFDFLAGTTQQAPRWMQRNGLEWAYRLAREPKRLARRYLWGNSVFALEAVETLRRSKND